MKFNTLFFFLSIAGSLVCREALSQQINLYSIRDQRQPGGDNGYTLDGAWMTNSRAKLLDPSNFGDNGIYPKTILITDDFGQSNSLTTLHLYPNIDILFIGSFDKLAPELNQFSEDELDTLYSWSKSGGKLIIAPQASLQGSWDFTEFDSRWGFSIQLSNPSIFNPTPMGAASDIFNGAFGQVSTANQGAASQGYFNNLPQDAIVLAQNAGGEPTLFLDCNTLDLICADVDAFTWLGGISSGSAISNEQDRFWANVITYMDKLESPPVVVINDNQFAVGNYTSYQWLLNGTAIDGATNSNYTATDTGLYSVVVTYKTGCTSVSTATFYLPEDTTNTIPTEDGCDLTVPSAFSPNGDGKNDRFDVLGYGLAKISSFHFSVFNRWGQDVFETTDIDDGWDGTFDGEKQVDGVFVYDLEGICMDTGKKIHKSGSVTLVR